MATLSDFMPREIEILLLILSGRINKASAAKISISKKLLRLTITISAQRLVCERAASRDSFMSALILLRE